MRVVFLGTPADAVPALEGLCAAGHEIALVITQPDRRRGRAGKGPAGALHPSPVKAAATKLGLRVLEPVAVGAVLDEVRRSGAELGVVVAFGQLIPTAVLDVPPAGFVNLHFSLLPRWR
ncbi:MAG: methionyl-tRNA formyltransferase, partial [Acidimicrobiia bacterium]